MSASSSVEPSLPRLRSTSFYLNLPIGGAALLIFVLFYRTPGHFKPMPATRMAVFQALDIPGLIVITGALLCLFLALEWGGISKAWGSADVIGTLVGSFCLTVVFIVIQWLQDERALVPRRILKQRHIAACCAFILW